MSTIKTPHDTSGALVLHADGTGGEVHFKIGSDIIDSNTGAVTPAPIKGKVDSIGFFGDGSQLTGITVDSNEASRRNLIDNGSMMVWERSRSNRTNPLFAPVTTGTDAIGRSFNVLDRFETNPSNKTGLIQQSRSEGDGGALDALETGNTSISPIPYKYWLELTDTAGTGNYFVSGDVMLRHTIENSEYNLADREFTLSFWMRQFDSSNPRNLKARMRTHSHGNIATFLDETFELKKYNDPALLGKNGWARHSFTFTRPPVSTAGTLSDDYNFDIFEIVYDSGVEQNTTYGISGIQLEKGSTATEFIDTSYTEELAKCQRFFQYRSIVNWQYRFGNGGTNGEYNIGNNMISGYYHGSNLYRFSFDLPVEMSGTPTLELQWDMNNGTKTGYNVNAIEFNKNSFGVLLSGSQMNTESGSIGELWALTHFLDIRYWKLDSEPLL